ncbi:uncharacterized protein LOC143037495 [Oratosquilla oratoria]|uniref:uncharacterized protein LOC143037495 n=1 Tax=Oratosquilla oratoria TaxID=337810 RepID=UPI003F771DBF
MTDTAECGVYRPEEDNQPVPFTQAEHDDMTRDLNLSKESAQLLGSCVQDRLCAFAEGKYPCLTPLPPAQADPHIWCIKCRGLKCSPSSPCETCTQWDDNQWSVYFHAHKKGHAGKKVHTHRKWLPPSPPENKSRHTATSEEMSNSLPPQKRSRQEGCAMSTSSQAQAKLSYIPSTRAVSLDRCAPPATSSYRSCTSFFPDAVACGSPSTLPGSSTPRRTKNPGSKKKSTLASSSYQESRSPPKTHHMKSRVISGDPAMPVDQEDQGKPTQALLAVKTTLTRRENHPLGSPGPSEPNRDSPSGHFQELLPTIYSLLNTMREQMDEQHEFIQEAQEKLLLNSEVRKDSTPKRAPIEHVPVDRNPPEPSSDDDEDAVFLADRADSSYNDVHSTVDEKASYQTLQDSQSESPMVVKPSFSEILAKVRRANRLDPPQEEEATFKSKIFKMGNLQKTKPPPIQLPWSTQTTRVMSQASDTLTKWTTKKARWLYVPMKNLKRYYTPSGTSLKEASIPARLPELVKADMDSLLRRNVILSGRESRDHVECLALSLAVNSWLERLLASIREFLPKLQPQEECDLQALLESSSRALKHQATCLSASWANIESRRRDTILGDPSDPLLREIYAPLKRAPLLTHTLIPPEMVDSAIASKNQLMLYRAIERVDVPTSRPRPTPPSAPRPSQRQRQSFYHSKKEKRPPLHSKSKMQTEKPRPFLNREPKRRHHRGSRHPHRKF